MANHDFDIGILGGGAAGLTIASGAARLGAKTSLLKRTRNWEETASIVDVFPVRPLFGRPTYII